MASLTRDTLLSRLTSADWWFRSAEGRLTVWQLPNPALWVWLGAVLLGLLDLTPDAADTVEGVRRGALLVWALDETVRGASPFRRVLGLVVLVPLVTSLLGS